MIISIVLFTIRRFFPYPLFFDSILTLLFVMSYLKLTHLGKLTKWLEFLGRHSMNIFLFHTFIFLYYFHDIVYCSGNPFLIFLTLLCSCLAISMGMEYLKKAIRFDVFCKQLIRKLKWRKKLQSSVVAIYSLPYSKFIELTLFMSRSCVLLHIGCILLSQKSRFNV